VARYDTERYGILDETTVERINRLTHCWFGIAGADYTYCLCILQNSLVLQRKYPQQVAMWGFEHRPKFQYSPRGLFRQSDGAKGHHGSTGRKAIKYSMNVFSGRHFGLFVLVVWIWVCSTLLGSSHNRTIEVEPKEFVLWSTEETYFRHCRQAMLRNRTWGEQRAPLADKIQAKHLAREWSPSVKIVPTLAIFDSKNISSFTLDRLRDIPQPFVIKPAHGQGGVAIVQNDTYQIIKRMVRGLINPTPKVPLHGLDAESYHQRLLNVTMPYQFSDGGEMQYEFLQPRILVEQALDMGLFRDVTYWYMVNGAPVFVSMECSGTTTNDAPFCLPGFMCCR
jgi:TupA-like ATPgrasp